MDTIRFLFADVISSVNGKLVDFIDDGMVSVFVSHFLNMQKECFYATRVIVIAKVKK